MVDVKIESLSKYFNDVKAVDNIDLSIKDGELFFLLGPSGCGKTTLLRMLAGFYQADIGKIYFGDQQMNGIPAHKRRTGMVFQNYALWPHMTVEKNVSFGLEIQKLSKDEIKNRVMEALKSVRMEKYAERLPNQLSGGQQQRVALARALVIRPKVILLDEPLSNLDAKLRLEMRSEIKRIHRETRITTIYVTHDQKEALSMADRMAIINEGRIEQIGTPEDIYNKPINPFVAGFIGETNFISGKLKKIENEFAVIETSLGEIKSKAFPENLTNNSNVKCSIRPESVHLLYPNSTYPTKGKNIVEFKIADRVYLGEVDQYQLSGPGNLEFRAMEVNVRGKGVNEGNIQVAINPKDVVTFRS